MGEKYYDIVWDNVKTIKDLKAIMVIFASKIIIDHNDKDDVKIFESIKHFVIESTDN